MPRIVMITDDGGCRAEYLLRHGWHFSPAAERFAASLMERRNAKGGVEAIEPFTAEEVDETLNAQGVTLERPKGCDRVYVANMCKADYWKSSIEDAKHLALFIKDTIDDPDAPEGHVFRRWLADIEAKGVEADWEGWL